MGSRGPYHFRPHLATRPNPDREHVLCSPSGRRSRRVHRDASRQQTVRLGVRAGTRDARRAAARPGRLSVSIQRWGTPFAASKDRAACAAGAEPEPMIETTTEPLTGRLTLAPDGMGPADVSDGSATVSACAGRHSGDAQPMGRAGFRECPFPEYQPRYVDLRLENPGCRFRMRASTDTSRRSRGLWTAFARLARARSGYRFV
jgi:hypothetical protein